MGQSRVDGDGQPTIKGFNFKRNREKAAYALRGLLQGIVADKGLGPQELLFLDTWLRSQQQLDGGDVIDLLDLISDVLADEVVTTDELNEIYALIDDIIKYGDKASDIEASINELLGLILGIVADGKFTDDEFTELDSWLQKNQRIATEWPASEIASRIRQFRADGIVEQVELNDLLSTLKQMSGYDFESTGMADGGVAEVFSDDVRVFEHRGRTICFTGKFVCGTRSTVENTATGHGARISRNVTHEVDTLVVGTLASRDWRFTSHGRKIEKALKLKQDGAAIDILSERHWRKFV